MMDLITSLLPDIWAYVAAAVVAIGGVLGVYVKGRKDAKDKAKHKATEQALKDERLRDEIDADTDSPDARDRLRKDWAG